jgi:hypothetical protein
MGNIIILSYFSAPTCRTEVRAVALAEARDSHMDATSATEDFRCAGTPPSRGSIPTPDWKRTINVM